MATISCPISININAVNAANTTNAADACASARACGDATSAAAAGVTLAPEEVPPNDPGGFKLAFGELEGAVPPPSLPTGGMRRGHPGIQHVERIVVLGTVVTAELAATAAIVVMAADVVVAVVMGVVVGGGHGGIIWAGGNLIFMLLLILLALLPPWPRGFH